MSIETKKILRCVLHDKLKCAIAPSINYNDITSNDGSKLTVNRNGGLFNHFEYV